MFLVSDDFRLFCGDLGNDVTDEVLIRAFSKYPSFQRARVVRDRRTNKTKGFGFVSFADPQDFIKATKEMNGKFLRKYFYFLPFLIGTMHQNENIQCLGFAKKGIVHSKVEQHN